MNQIDLFIRYKEEIGQTLIKRLKDFNKDKSRKFNFILNEKKSKLQILKKEEEIKK